MSIYRVAFALEFDSECGHDFGAAYVDGEPVLYQEVLAMEYADSVEVPQSIYSDGFWFTINRRDLDVEDRTWVYVYRYDPSYDDRVPSEIRQGSRGAETHAELPTPADHRWDDVLYRPETEGGRETALRDTRLKDNRLPAEMRERD